MAGLLNHTSLRRLVAIVASVFLFGCAVQAARPLPDKAVAGAKSGKEAKVKPAKNGKAATSKAAIATREPVNEKPGRIESRQEVSALPADPVVMRPMFHYDYYPDREVYFDTDRLLYFYRTGGEWSMSVALPISFQEHLGTSVQLKLESPRPYEFHDQNIKDFPSGTGGRDF